MTRANSGWFIFCIAAILCFFHLTVSAQQSGKKEYTFHGQVKKVDTKAKSLTVDGENVEGWMEAMTMAYHVDKQEVLGRVKPGDQITAKVYAGDYTLHGVQVVHAKNKPPLKK